MVCSRCGSHSAVQYELTVGGKRQAVVLCKSCHDALYGEGEEKAFFDSLFGKRSAAFCDADLTCPVCGTTVEEYRASGLLGCAHCYTALKEELMPTIRRIQGKTQHEGRAPAGDAGVTFYRFRELVDEREQLKEQLEGAIREGNYALADRLKERLLEINHTLYRGEKA